MAGWAILGTGAVSVRFAAGLASLGNAARIVAVASREESNAMAFATRYGGAVADYAGAVEMPGVDAVYVATPPALHEIHALLAIAAGKAALIEKPFAIDSAAASRIVDSARTAGVFCMEAMWTRFMPILAEAQAQVASGVLGELRTLSASFMGSDLPDPTVSLFDPELGGGALLHRGIYPLSLARMLLGPAEVVGATARIGDTGVDEDCTVLLRHSHGCLSTLTASLRAPGPNSLVLAGTRGALEVEAPIYRPFRARLSRVNPTASGKSGLRGGRWSARRDSALVQGLRQLVPATLLTHRKRLFRPYVGNGYHYEAAEVELRLARGDIESPLLPLDESVDIARLMDAARAEFHRTGRPS